MALSRLGKVNSSSAPDNVHSGTLWGWLVWNGSNTLPAVPLRSVERDYVATVGRHPDNNIVIPANLADSYLFKYISRNHCTLERAVNEDVTVVLCLSVNGTFVDGERVPHLRKLQVYHGSLVSLCSADSTVSFNYYDSSHFYLGHHRELNSKFFVLNVESSGAYGEVCKVIIRDTCSIAAVKTVHANTRGSPYASEMVNPRGVSSLRNEIICLSQLEHPCIIKMFDSADQWPANRMFIAMEFLSGGELQQRMYNCNYLSEMNTKFFFVQMISAIKYCHGDSPPIVHRNLFPHNVLLASNDILTPIKIADFGLAKLVTCSTSLTLCCGAELYIAPEMRRHLDDDDDAEPYTPAVDIWSLGVMLNYMLFGRHPACARANHTGLSTSTEQYGLPSNGLPPNEGASKAYCETVSKQALSLIDGMLAIDVGLRYSLEDVIGCQWLRDEDTMAQLRERVFKDTPIF